MTDRPPLEATDVLRIANHKGEVGYAFGGAEKDWPAMQECLDRGWLVYGYDASTNNFSWLKAQTRAVYLVTEKGHQALAFVEQSP